MSSSRSRICNIRSCTFATESPNLAKVHTSLVYTHSFYPIICTALSSRCARAKRINISQSTTNQVSKTAEGAPFVFRISSSRSRICSIRSHTFGTESSKVHTSLVYTHSVYPIICTALSSRCARAKKINTLQSTTNQVSQTAESAPFVFRISSSRSRICNIRSCTFATESSKVHTSLV